MAVRSSPECGFVAVNDLAEAGRAAARRLWREGLKAAVRDPLEPEFAVAAVTEFARLQSERTPGIYRDALEGAEISAEQLNVEPFHGVIEVLQNADDARATELRLALRTRSGRRHLLFAHDGESLRLPDVVAMAVAFVSTKRDDALQKGRFGIGLKTLSALGDSLSVHGGPYHALIMGNRLAPAAPARAITGFFLPGAGDTLLELRLRADFDADAFEAWAHDVDAASLLFLDTVRAVRILRLRSAKPLAEVRLEQRRAGANRLAVGRHSLDCDTVNLSDPLTGRSWRRYTVERPVPASAPKRRHKATGRTTPLAVAVPDRAGDSGRLFAGLPLGEGLGVPFSLSAQFNVDTPRTGVQHDDWNRWLLDRLFELIAAVARDRFQREPATAWAAVPLVAEMEAIADVWLRNRLVDGSRSILTRLTRALTFQIDGETRRAHDVAYEARELERLLDAGDLALLRADLAPLPRSVRDRLGRWRAVLAELGVATEIEIGDALGLLDLDDSLLGDRPVSWYIRFARVTIAADEGGRLWWLRSLVLADGTRVVPPAPHVEAEVLVRRARPGSLAARLGLARVIHPAYLSRNPEAAAVRRWLEQSGILAEDVGDEPALRALARRGMSDEPSPVEVDDDCLVAIRGALAALEQADREELGPGIGRAISLRGFRWERGVRVRQRVAPAEAYVPARLEDRSDGWAKAAAKTPGLRWIETRYVEVLRRAKRGQRSPAALSFLRLLDAEVAPRLVAPAAIETRHGDPASPIDFAALTASQREALAGRHATHFKHDSRSPDLARVVTDIGRERSRSRRRERARALLLTLEREWRRVYQGHEEAIAVYSSYSWVPEASVPASWIAVAMDTPWLTTESGTSAPPRELVVRTRLTEALYGRDAARFAADIGQEVAASAATRALGLITDPRVSEMVDQLSGLQAAGEPVDPALVAVRYAAIAAAVTNVDAPPESMVGDLTVRQLRTRFAGVRGRRGLILVDGEWLAPANVLRGRPVFGDRRAVVPDRSHADRLWRILRIATPSLLECVAVLNELAGATPGGPDEQVLLDTYVYMSEHLPEATRRELRAIGELPLWSGRRWLTERPIYAVDDPDVARQLAAKLPVWQPPVSPRSLGNLVSALGVSLLDDSDFAPLVGDAERLAGEAVAETFAAAIAHLREWLARHDPTLSESLAIAWDALADARIALAPNLQLEMRVPGRRVVRVPARAHMARAPLQLSAADIADIGADDAGGRALASLFTSGDRDKLALAWAACWSRARLGDRTARLTLAEDEAGEDPLDALFVQAATTTKRHRRQTPARQATSRTDGQGQRVAAARPVRRLKSPDDLNVASLERPAGHDGTGSQRGSRGLRSDKPQGEAIDPAAQPASRSAPLAYSPQEQEHLALIALQRAINGELADLRDFRHLRGVGADALDRLGRAFEIKSFATTLPDQVTLTANEFERALKDGPKYLLAVIAGLEEGYDTVVRIIADPVRALRVQKSTTLVLGGVRSAHRPIEVRFNSSNPDGPDGVRD
jgi:hypothetical protein